MWTYYMNFTVINPPTRMDAVSLHCHGLKCRRRMYTAFFIRVFFIILTLLQLVLVHCKPGAVYLWSAFPLATKLPLTWSGSRTMLLQTQRISVGSSSLYPVSGMMYVRSEDCLVLCLFDGSFHVIHGLSVDPSYFPRTSTSPLMSEKLSATSRSIFAQAEMRDIRSTDVNRTSGMMSYDCSSTVVWAHEYVSLMVSSSALLTKGTGHVDRQTSVISTKQNTTACSLSHSCGTTPVALPSQMISQLS